MEKSNQLKINLEEDNSRFLQNQEIEAEIRLNNGENYLSEARKNCDGVTMFDKPNSKDNLVTVLIPKNKLGLFPSQTLVEIESEEDKKTYRGIVIEGPFHEPDGLKADAPIMVTSAVNGMSFIPNYHGRVHVEILGEYQEGQFEPPRYRPLPNSPVKALGSEEINKALQLEGDLKLGLLYGHDKITVGIPSDSKMVLPRHLGVLGTTGGGKSTTVSGLIKSLQDSNVAVILFDTEGEYVQIDRPTGSNTMLKILKKQGLEPKGVNDLKVLHLVGKSTNAAEPTSIQDFTLFFSEVSPYLAAEILDLNNAQSDRFFKAYDVAKSILKALHIYPISSEEKKEALDIDEFETGYPKMTLSFLIDVSNMLLNKVSKTSEYDPYNDFLKGDKVKNIVNPLIERVKTDSSTSWRALLSKLWKVHKTKIFDQEAGQIDYDKLLEPGNVTIIDLNDTASTLINNLVISSILRKLQLKKNELYEKEVSEKKKPSTAMIIIEEAHEFLSKDKISKMENLFQQVARIAKRGRKRRLGLTFVTQLPQHLPDDILGLLNSYIIHKIGDSNVIGRLKRSIGGVDDSLWNRVTSLPPGQAVVSSPSFRRPVLVTINPTTCKLLLND